jgi:hypothetical protein
MPVFSPVTYTSPASGLSLTEPLTGTVGTTVNVTADAVTPPAVAPTVTVVSVTCANASEFCQPYDMVITKTSNSFTFSSAFVDLFDRQVKYTKHYSILEMSWNGSSLIDPIVTTNGTNLVTIKTFDSRAYRVGDSITIIGGLTPSQKRLIGTWKIVSIPGADGRIVASTELFDTFVIKVSSVITIPSTTLNQSYSTYHVANRVRYAALLDTSISPSEFYGIYQFKYPPDSRLITFNITYTLSTAPSTQLTTTWSFRLLSNYNVTMSLLNTAVARGESSVNSPAITELPVP